MKNSFTIKEVRNFWDEVAPIYEPLNKNVGYVHTQRFERALQFADIQDAQRILNIWSRTGTLISYLRKAAKNLEIVNREASPKMIEIARNNHPHEQFELTDLENLSEFSDNSFDRIISLETLEHVPNPSTFMFELHRILRPGGRIIMSLPPKGAEVPEYIYTLFFTDHGEGPHRFLWPHEVRHLLAETGLQLNAHKPFIILPFGSDWLVRTSEKVLTFLFGKTPLANFGVRHFYIATKTL